MRQRKVLEDDAGLGKIHRQLVHIGLRLFAVGALEVGKLDNLQILGGVSRDRDRRRAAARWRALPQRDCAPKGMMSSPAKMCLPSGRTKNWSRDELLLAGLVAHQQGHLADAIDFRLLDGPHLPDTGLIVAPTGLQKGVDGVLVGEVAVKLAGSGLGKTGAAAAGAGAEGACAAGAAGTSCWAAAWRTGRNKATSARAPAKRIDRRIKLFLLQLWKS